MTQRGPVHILAVQPPPLNGATHVTANMIDAVSAVSDINVPKVTNPNGYHGIRWTISKHMQLLRALIVGGFASKGRENCYFVPDAQHGLFLNMLEAPLLRLGYRTVWLHNQVFSYVRRNDWRMRFVLWVLGSKARHIVLSQRMADGMLETYGVTDCHIFSSACFVRDAPEPRLREKLTTIGFLSNITREKGISLFLDVAERAQVASPEIDVLIGGPTKDPKIKAEIEAFCAGNPARRKWLGAVRGAEKKAFFEQVDVLLFPTIYLNEALPITIFEGMSASAPVLSTPFGCIPDQLEGRDWIFAPESYVDRASEILRAWADEPTLFAKASIQSRESYDAHLADARASLDALVHKISA